MADEEESTREAPAPAAEQRTAAREKRSRAVDPDLPREGGDVPPMTAFDPDQQANYHLDAAGNAVIHGIPEGFAFDANGELQPVAEGGASHRAAAK